MAVLLDDPFTGTDTDPWDTAKWTAAHVNTGFDYIESNEGVLENGATDPSSARMSADFTAVADQEILVENWEYLNQANTRLVVALRGGTAWESGLNPHRPTDGYYLQSRFNSDSTGDNHLVKMVAGGVTVLQGFTWSTSAATRYSLRFQAVDDGSGGVDLRGRFWLAGSGEPGTWNLFDVKDSSSPITSGVPMLSLTRSDASLNEVHIDRIEATDLAAGDDPANLQASVVGDDVTLTWDV